MGPRSLVVATDPPPPFVPCGLLGPSGRCSLGLYMGQGGIPPAFLGFPASAADLRKRRAPIRRFFRSTPPPLLLSFAEALAMDKSSGSSSEAVSDSKHRRDDSPAMGVDLEYEASLRSKMEAK
ncbi:hypothetical protein VPH35_074371 [Triticum aestivum]